MSDEKFVKKQVEIARKTAQLKREEDNALQYELEASRQECARQRGRAEAFREMKEQAERSMEELRVIARKARSFLDSPLQADARDLPDGWEWSDIPSKDGNSTRVLYAYNEEGHTVEVWRDSTGHWLDSDGADLEAVKAVLARYRAMRMEGL